MTSLLSPNPPPQDSGTAMSVRDRLQAALTQYPMPHHALTALMRGLTRCRFGPWKRWQIRWFIHRYRVNMAEAAQPDPLAYPDFNTFFTRALRADARPLVSEPHLLACPVDGAVSQAGNIKAGRIFQAKGRDYSLVELLGGDITRAAPFDEGAFATLYLSPRDYHRVHMPLQGRLKQIVYVPGRLFSVNPSTTRSVPALFARNERLVTLFDTDAGPMALVLVGAMFVAGIETLWTGDVCETAPHRITVWDYHDQNLFLPRGAEMGRFNMGSTVIVLFGSGRVQWATTLEADAPIRMGEPLGRCLQNRGNGEG